MTQAEQLAAQAAQWQAAGRADMAAQLYTASLDQDPSKFAVRMQLAECLAYLGQPEQASEQYLMVAQAYAARSRLQECMAICERILNIAPQAFVYMSVGPMIRRIGRHARPLCAKAAELHLNAGRQTDGLQILRLGAELDPHNPEVRRQLARIYQSRHMQREAVEALTDAGGLLIQAKRYDEYIQVAAELLAIDPNDVGTLRDLPRVYLELGKPHEAVRTLGQLTRASPGDIVGYEILAQAFALIGRTDKAISVLERLVEELGATGQGDKADAILNHARYWRPTDLGFLRSLKRVEVPRPRPRPSAPAGPPPQPAPEGTVMLSIADLVMDEDAAPPAREDSAIQLVEADGTLTLNLEELIIDETSSVAVAPPGPPPTPTDEDSSGNATVSLDGSSLIAMMQEVPDGDQSEPTRLDGKSLGDEPSGPSVEATHHGYDGGSAPPLPTPAESSASTTGSMSELIYDDEDDDSEVATLLHLKPLTAEDIARAQQGMAQHEPPDDTGAMTTPIQKLSGSESGDDPTLAGSGADDMPTMSRMRPLTQADIDDALTHSGKKPAPPIGDDDITSPTPTAPPAPPQAPPMLNLAPPAPEVEDDDEHTVVRMTALTPEDIERARRKKLDDDS
ncbi:MAG: tetratricopeptide repeat protein [Myxococcota bacterium]